MICWDTKQHGDLEPMKQPANVLLHMEICWEIHLFMKSTDAIAVVLELSDMFNTSTSNPMCHISVFTAYLKTLNSDAVQAHELGVYKPCLVGTHTG